MLNDTTEIDIVSRAEQPNVRNPNRSRASFDSIFEDFLCDVRFEGSELIDLGPGQFDFGELARARGAARIVGIDKDPAVIELGRHKGFDVRPGLLQGLRASAFPEGFDGVFCKFSVSPFWAREDAQIHALVDEVAGLVKAGGWAWFAPWNGVPRRRRLSAARVRQVLDIQAGAFRTHGFDAFDISDDLARRYGITGGVANHALFTLNLPLPDAVARCARL